MTRIGHVIADYLPASSGGTELCLRDLCRGLRARGHEVTIFAGRHGVGADYEIGEDEHDGVRVTRVTNDFRDVDAFTMLWANPQIDACFAAWLRRAKPELVHVHHLSGLSTNLIQVARDAGLPCVLTLHDWWLVCPRGQRLHPIDLDVCEPLDRGRCLPCLSALWPHLLQVGDNGLSAARLARFEAHVRRMLDLCQVLITPSAFHRDRFVAWGADPARCFAVPHGLSRQGFPEAPRPPRPLEAIGFVGTVIPSKGVHVLVEAFARLARTDLTLHVHGAAPSFHGDTGYLDRLRALLPPTARAVFHGAYARDDLPAILAALDVLVVPSIWWETFCLTVREGALAQVPVVCSDHGAMREAVQQGLALGFEPGNAVDLARVLQRLADDDALRQRMSQKSQLVRELDASVAHTEFLYEQALGGKRP